MKLIVGLGNPGEKYELTRHNYGFLVLDALATKYDGKFNFSKRFKAEITEIFINGEKIILLKPQSFMNNSGEVVREIIGFFNISTDRIWVVYDDVDLELGTVRIRKQGSSGGHKGVQSIIDNVGTADIPRFRMGIKSKHCDELSTEDVVLQRFKPDEIEAVEIGIKKAVEAINKALEKGIENISV